ncbi:MAG TPA: bifunctional riboflavin kinase/FAD synthetase [Flavobacteriaceae bacterium]|jgi:riboflavin kinase/FMN adenylyltransferase|nr:riboflavin biosynthesis protein RibF [Flavobacteriaceae bacterium]MDP7183969.1 bifunctional riboflavin kinase/FAD synthetase [Flavobacteriaceae bacterium]HJO71166.1 bifunctional riboflavin kinase/FAD synthetase [Flavobacteriaceae bacterium]|tara:strand:+ start:724 stop:1650 length:927 start_codon:yes stop_codon:yes gene_type:complete
MKIFNNIQSYSPEKESILTIGTFDGVHIGHNKILTKLVEESKKNNLSSLIMTFFPHPRMVLQKSQEIKMIDTIDEKIHLFEKTGVDNLIIQPFDENFSKIRAKEFVEEILVKKLKIKHIIIGYDHRFGKDREASVDDLKKFGLNYMFTVEEIAAQEIHSIAISSTKIRNAILKGEIKKCNEYLGRNFMLTGEVVHGDGLGKKINFPTANIEIAETYKIIPKNGVYLVKAIINSEIYFGMMNIGVRPTIGGKNKSLEIHFFNFKDNIYNKTISVEIICKIRDEEEFSSIDELKIQLKKDEQFCLKLINK